MNVRKKLALGITEKPGAFHTSFHPEGWRYVGFHMFFCGDRPAWCECRWRRVSLWICPHPALSGLSGHVVLVIMCDWYWLVMCAGKMTCSSVCVSVSVSACVDFCSIMYSLMFIVFGDNLSWNAFELVSPVFFPSHELAGWKARKNLSTATFDRLCGLNSAPGQCGPLIQEPWKMMFLFNWMTGWWFEIFVILTPT